MIDHNSTNQTEVTATTTGKTFSPEVMAAAARWQERKDKRLAAKRNRINNPAHLAAVAQHVAMADDRLSATEDAAGYRL